MRKNQKLRELAIVSAGQSAPQGDNNYCSDGVPFIKAGNLVDLLDGKQEYEMKKVNESVAQAHGLKLYPAGTIIFAKSGMSCMKGYVYQLKTPCYVVSHLACIMATGIFGEYLKYFLEYHKPNSLIKDESYPSISLADIGEMSISYGSDMEQQKIVCKLNIIDKIIKQRKHQLEKLDLLVKAQFIEMFGDIRQNDKKWNIQPLGELCTIVRGGSPRPIEQYLGGDIPWIKIGDASDEDSIYLNSTKEHIILDGVSRSRMIKAGSLIFANCGVSLGFARIITFDGCIHDGWLAMENIDARLDKVFLLYSLNQMTEHFRKIAPAGTQPNLNTAIMKSHMQMIPPIDLQKHFISFVEQTEKIKSTIKHSLDKLTTLKNALMQKYFG